MSSLGAKFKKGLSTTSGASIHANAELATLSAHYYHPQVSTWTVVGEGTESGENAVTPGRPRETATLDPSGWIHEA